MGIFDHLRQPALVLDCEGRVVIWNESMERYTGIRAEDIVGEGGYAHGEALFGEKFPTLANRILSRGDAGDDTRYRLSAREDGKVIAGYHADLANEALGFNVLAFIQITLATHSPNNAKRFRDLMRRVDEIQEAYSLTGDADYLLKVVLSDLKSLSDIVNNVLMPHESVAHVRSSIVLDRLKTTRKLPLKKLSA